MQSRRQNSFWHGWNLAIESVWQGLSADELVKTVTPDQETLRKKILDYLARLFPDEDLLKPKPTNAQLAAKYAIAPRTVVNWRAAGCPFEDGQWHVLDWLAERRIVPGDAKAKFSRQLERRNGNVELDDLAGLSFRVKELARAVRRAGF